MAWDPKDPSAVTDYLFTVPLDEGDTVAGDPTVTRLAGTVQIDSQSLDSTIVSTPEVARGQNLTLWFSGGADGETDVFEIAWTTVGGRTPNPAIVTLLVMAATDAGPLLLTDYAKPAAAHLLMRYPAFAAVPPATVAYWLTDAERYVTDAWGEGDYAAGLMSLAAHNMALAGYGTSGTLAAIPKGVSRFKSGTLDVTLTDAAANGSGYEATIYGTEYAMLLRRNRGGPYVAPTGIAPEYAYPPFGVGYPW